ncbi:glycosyltransferase [Conexibacter sp. DBS9H8]|nr:glycosyltransferase [Conexibacter sp. DBS9H8]
MPRVSILLPAFRPDFLDACLASALAETCGDVELRIGALGQRGEHRRG